jgi:hypothetical protein
MALNTPFTTGQVYTASAANGMPFGLVENKIITTAQTGISTAVDLTGFSITFTAVTNRRYMVLTTFNPQGTAGQYAQINLNINGSPTRYYRVPFVVTGLFQSTTLQEQFVATAGSCTVKLQMAKGGAANVDNYADGSFNSNFCILDLGER